METTGEEWSPDEKGAGVTDTLTQEARVGPRSGSHPEESLREWGPGVGEHLRVFCDSPPLNLRLFICRVGVIQALVTTPYGPGKREWLDAGPSVAFRTFGLALRLLLSVL